MHKVEKKKKRRRRGSLTGGRAYGAGHESEAEEEGEREGS